MITLISTIIELSVSLEFCTIFLPLIHIMSIFPNIELQLISYFGSENARLVLFSHGEDIGLGVSCTVDYNLAVLLVRVYAINKPHEISVRVRIV